MKNKAYIVFSALLILLQGLTVNAGGQAYALGTKTYMDRLPADIQNLLKEKLENHPVLAESDNF